MEFKVGDRVAVVKNFCAFRKGDVVVVDMVGSRTVVVRSEDGRRSIAWTNNRNGYEIAHLPTPVDEFDQGGLKRMPDGTLESVHIPTEKEAVIPYTATGTGGPPKPKPPVLEWKVKVRFGSDPAVSVELYVDGKKFGGQELSRPEARYLTARQERKLAKKVAEAKENILRLYRLTLKESGCVE